MSKNKYFLAFFFVYLTVQVKAQKADLVWKQKTIAISSQDVMIDSFSLIPGSIVLVNKITHEIIPSSNYIINAATGKLKFKEVAIKNKIDSAIISYRTFPFSFIAPSYHKDINLVQPIPGFIVNPFIYTPSSSLKSAVDFGGLNYNGSYTRGISFGNTQDFVTNSNFNLQLSGKINNDVEVNAAMTDNNIPIQPEGNTQQIQDFDKIFIQLRRKNVALKAGDIDQYSPDGYFLKYYKKLQGFTLETEYVIPKFKSVKKDLPSFSSTELKPSNSNTISATNYKQFTNKLLASAAIARGKYNRQTIVGQESNQGPYRLRGANGESFIVVLAGSERVYMDGELLKRGAENDYVIDYNLAEVIFTPQRLLTKDKRIVIDFLYADRNYLHTSTIVSDAIGNDKFNFRLTVFQESDAKNQPQQPFLKNEKYVLRNAGDSATQSVIGSAVKTAFDVNKVLYRKVDTVINGNRDSIFIQSTNRDSVLYTVSFSPISGKAGDYIQLTTATNGRVYVWAGKGKGSYLPIEQIVAPKSASVVTLGGSYKMNKSNALNAEVALSHFDANTFSSKDDADNNGTAFKVAYLHNQSFLKNQGVTFNSAVQYEYTDHRFKTPEPFRQVEFQRDWNVLNNQIKHDEHLASAVIDYQKNTLGAIHYKVATFLQDSVYKALQQEASCNIRYHAFGSSISGSYLTSNATTKYSSSFFRPKADIYYTVAKLGGLKLGTSLSRESNRIYSKGMDTLDFRSFFFDEFKYYLTTSDTAKNKFSSSFTQRWDKKAVGQSFTNATFAQAWNSSFALNSFKNFNVLFSLTYRKLKIVDSTLTMQKPDQALLGSLDYTQQLLKGLLNYNMHYELGSGQELKREYAYLKVAEGQGQYAWNDLNGDNQQQLNEFTDNDFSDKKSYVKILIPTTTYVKANNIQFNHSIVMEPENLWGEKYGAKKWMNRFTLQSTLQYQQKSFADGNLKRFNPLIPIPDSLHLAGNVMSSNTLYFNRSMPVYSANISLLNNVNKQLLTFGIETRRKMEHQLQQRLNVSQHIGIRLNMANGIKSLLSDNVVQQKYKFHYYYIEPKVDVILSNRIRITPSYNYKAALNPTPTHVDSAIIMKGMVDSRINLPGKSVLTFNFSLATVKYNSSTNTQAAYAILEGLQPGSNYLWGIGYERKLATNMEMSLIYDGRKTGDKAIVHTGRASVRAIF